MNTKELAIKIADKFGISVRMAERIIRFATDEIKDTVKAGGAVRVAQFGSFCRVDKPEREYNTPVGGRVTVPAHGTVKFNASGYFKEILK